MNTQIKEQSWFEMRKIRNGTYADDVWIPLRAAQDEKNSIDYGFTGYTGEFFGLGSVAIPLTDREAADALGWMDVGLSNRACGYVQENQYIPASTYGDYRGFQGENLVLEQSGSTAALNQWHLNQDLAITLGLQREDDTWVRPIEGYIEVVRLHKDDEGSPILMEIRARHLRDYLCARKMALYLVTYRDRVQICENTEHIDWGHEEKIEDAEHEHWSGRILPIHEGGEMYGAEAFVMHVKRTDVDEEKDVPKYDFPKDGDTESESWTKKFEGEKLYRISGELWKEYWIEPAEISPIVKGDKESPTAFFITDAQGTQESKETLDNGQSRWLWFNPSIVNEILKYRDGYLNWYTRDTGGLGFSESDGVHFGVNSIGLINVYAKDIGLLPDWQQKIWSGFNVAPEGGVASELQASQMRATPAATMAPEEHLVKGLELMNQKVFDIYNVNIWEGNEKISKIMSEVHRFRATNEEGLYALAKDVSRVVADNINLQALRSIIPAEGNKDIRSLKALELLTSQHSTEEFAHMVMSPLFGTNDLRQQDAHIPSSDIAQAKKHARIDETQPTIIQAHQMLAACVTSIHTIWQQLKDSEVTK